MPYRFEASDRNYTEHGFFNTDTGDATTLDIDIMGSKLMHGDIVTADGNTVRLSSPTRETERIYGILVLKIRHMERNRGLTFTDVSLTISVYHVFSCPISINQKTSPNSW